jgi:glycosyltransferase involved in cell wall biosynthesis
MSQPSPASSSAWRLPQRVAYVVNHSYPYSSDGYAVRTHEVARALTEQGHDVIVFNRPGRPWDIEGFPSRAEVPLDQVIDGVRYVFLPSPATREMDLRPRLRLAEKVLLEAFEVFRPGVVLAVSNWETAEPAQYAARRLGVAFFYEQRGFWEMSRAACEPDFEKTKEYLFHHEREVRVAQAAEAVFTLNDRMRDELVRRGVREEKIHLVPNGVGKPGAIRKGVSRETIGCSSRYLLGYVGSLNDYEGVVELPRLLSILRRDGVDVDLLIVGSSAPKGLVGTTRDKSPVERKLHAEVERHGLSEHVHFVPQQPQDAVGVYYTMVDAIVMPRLRSPVTEMVTPLKPYAAAAYGTPVFMTDMPSLAAVAEDIHGSLFPEGDMDALAAQLRETLVKGGHPAVLNPLKPALQWSRRVQPMSRLLRAAGEAQPDLSETFGPPGAVAGGSADEVHAIAEDQGPRFNAHILPRVALRQTATASQPVAVIGPAAPYAEAERLIRLDRVNLLSELATAEVGRFVIDWAGLQADPDSAEAQEWAGLWSIQNMRLNRQIMDACRIALDRGWQPLVLGPVHRSQAPLYRTVADIFEEILPETQAGVQEAAQ